jgi:hypothetical protein
MQTTPHHHTRTGLKRRMQPVDENGIYVVTEEEAAQYGLEGTENLKKDPIPHDVDAGSINAGSTNQEEDIIVTPDMVKDKVQKGFGKALVVGVHQVSECSRMGSRYDVQPRTQGTMSMLRSSQGFVARVCVWPCSPRRRTGLSGPRILRRITSRTSPRWTHCARFTTSWPSSTSLTCWCVPIDKPMWTALRMTHASWRV